MKNLSHRKKATALDLLILINDAFIVPFVLFKLWTLPEEPYWVSPQHKTVYFFNLIVVTGICQAAHLLQAQHITLHQPREKASKLLCLLSLFNLHFMALIFIPKYHKRFMPLGEDSKVKDLQRARSWFLILTYLQLITSLVLLEVPPDNMQWNLTMFWVFVSPIYHLIFVYFP